MIIFCILAAAMAAATAWYVLTPLFISPSEQYLRRWGVVLCFCLPLLTLILTLVCGSAVYHL